MGINAKEIVWNFNVPDGMRQALLNKYVPISEGKTDKRYIKERKKLRSKSIPKSVNKMDVIEFSKTLSNNGIGVSSVLSAGQFNRQGSGNYWVISLEQLNSHYKTSIFVSELGKFATHDLHWIDGNERHYYNPLTEIEQNIILECKKIAESKGYYWLEPDLLAKIIPKLFIRQFGVVEELRIQDLLFYWED